MDSEPQLQYRFDFTPVRTNPLLERQKKQLRKGLESVRRRAERRKLAREAQAPPEERLPQELIDLYGDPEPMSDPLSINWELQEFFQGARDFLQELDAMEVELTDRAIALADELEKLPHERDWDNVAMLWNEITEENYTVKEVKDLMQGMRSWTYIPGESRGAWRRIRQLLVTSLFMAARTSIPK